MKVASEAAIVERGAQTRGAQLLGLRGSEAQRKQDSATNTFKQIENAIMNIQQQCVNQDGEEQTMTTILTNRKTLACQPLRNIAVNITSKLYIYINITIYIYI